MTIDSSAPSRRATRAASIAVLPPPYTATRRPITGRSPLATSCRNETASIILPASMLGMSTRLDRWAPMATKTASKPPSFCSASRSLILWFWVKTMPRPRNILDAEIDRLRGLGIVFTQNHKIKDLLAEQKEGGFDAVFVAIGAHLSKRVDIPSMDAGKMIDAVSFLHDVASGERPVIGRRVAVYGGGNTAMDAARVARRLGAEESIVIYRRGEEQMPANAAEKEEAIREGVQMNWLRTISAMDSDSMTVEIMELDESGKARGTGRYETMAADTVILALGQEADSNFLKNIPGLRFENDVVRVDPISLMTDVPGIFAGGDVVPSDRTVTIGVGHGKRAARMIDNWLFNRQAALRTKHPIATLDMLNLWYFGDHERRLEPELALEHRMDFAEVVEGLKAEEAHFEASRCLSCGNCIECDGCLGSCPEDAVIKLGKGYRYRYNYEKCTGCASCYEQCAVHAIEMIPEH